MKRVSAPVRSFHTLICCIGISVIGIALIFELGKRAIFTQFIAFWIVSSLLSILSIDINKFSGKNKFSLSLGFVGIFLSFMYCNLLQVLLISITVSIISTLVRKGSFYQCLFNLSSSAISISIIYHIKLYIFSFNFMIIKNNPIIWPIYDVLIIYFLITLYHSCIVLFASKMLSCSTHIPVRTALCQLWSTFPAYLAGGSASALFYIIEHHYHRQFWTITPFLILIIPLGLVIFRERKFHLERDEEHKTRLSEKEAYINNLEKKQNELKKNKQEIEELYYATVDAFALAIDAKDKYTQEHIQRVKLFSVSIANELGLDQQKVKAIETGAALHDIGKIAIPEHILNKPGRLTDEEFNIVKRHADLGSKILEPVNFPYSVMGAVRSHHERWDGTGYPDGLKGESIPLEGRILAVADVYDALTSDRPYRPGWTHQRAVEYIIEQSGTHFDPNIVNAFLRIVNKSKLFIGSEDIISELTNNMQNIYIDIDYISSIKIFKISLFAATCGFNEHILELLTLEILSMIGISTCIITFLDDNELITKASSGINSSFFYGSRVESYHGHTWNAAHNGSDYFGEYDPRDLLLVSSISSWTPINSSLISSLKFKNSIIGTLNGYIIYNNNENIHQIFKNIVDLINFSFDFSQIYDVIDVDSWNIDAIDMEKHKHTAKYIENISNMIKEIQIISFVHIIILENEENDWQCAQDSTCKYDIWISSLILAHEDCILVYKKDKNQYFIILKSSHESIVNYAYKSMLNILRNEFNRSLSIQVYGKIYDKIRNRYLKIEKYSLYENNNDLIEKVNLNIDKNFNKAA